MRFMETCTRGLLLFLAACAAPTTTPADSGLTIEPLATQTPTVVAQAVTLTPTITPMPTAAGPARLSVWWPEPLAPLDNGDAADVLSEQITAFQTAQGNVVVDLRWKNEQDPGGILSTLRTASPVAPGALPDLTLMRRSDLLLAVQDRLIYPLDDRISAAVRGDLYTAAIELGTVQGRLYGLPYALEVQHMVHLPEADLPASWRFSDVLATEGFGMVFPAAQTSGINSLFLAQYLAAGGSPPSEGAMIINEQALLTVLEFYENAVERRMIDPAVLNYATADDYWQALINGGVTAGLAGSTRYLRWAQGENTLAYSPIPTETGALTGAVNGWMWVLTTPNAERQALALRFLNWMLNAARQGDYTYTVLMLPSQRTALQQWPDSDYLDFARDLLNNATLPLTDSEGGTIGRAVQNALVAVISRQSTAEEVMHALIDQIDG